MNSILTSLLASSRLPEILAAVQETAPSGDGSETQTPGPGGLNLPFLVLMMVGVFYFVVFAPERKNRKRQEQMRASLGKGDKVMTTSGLFGTVVQSQDDIVVLQVAEGVRLKFTRAAIQDRIDPDAVKAKGEKAGKDEKGAKKTTESASEPVDAEFVEKS
ncbi:MAG: preprotein translocase subunit YajC [Planctomycetota bacterium]